MRERERERERRYNDTPHTLIYIVLVVGWRRGDHSIFTLLSSLPSPYPLKSSFLSSLSFPLSAYFPSLPLCFPFFPLTLLIFSLPSLFLSLSLSPFLPFLPSHTPLFLPLYFLIYINLFSLIFFSLLPPFVPFLHLSHFYPLSLLAFHSLLFTSLYTSSPTPSCILS